MANNGQIIIRSDSDAEDMDRSASSQNSGAVSLPDGPAAYRTRSHSENTGLYTNTDSSPSRPRSRHASASEVVHRLYTNMPSSSSVASAESSNVFRRMESLFPGDVQEESLETLETSASSCACQQVVISSSAIHCGICQNTIPALFEHKRLRLELYEQLDDREKKLRSEKDRSVRLLHDTAQQALRIAELETVVTSKDHEISNLKKDLHSLSAKLVKELEVRANIEAELERAKEELEDLTRSLFEEANGMVSDEARRRHELEIGVNSLKSELDETKKKLDEKEKQVTTLNKRLSEMSISNANSVASSPSPSHVGLSPDTNAVNGPTHSRPSFTQGFQKFLSASRTNSFTAMLSKSNAAASSPSLNPLLTPNPGQESTPVLDSLGVKETSEAPQEEK
ncbi:hypothetical protein MP638_002343 [Amoeboaphelidium occidentale]|nr:hypothetical protein MP638_002343 [Amoeboaphelidium occidentale]